jgi:hypothetical protein
MAIWKSMIKYLYRGCPICGYDSFYKEDFPGSHDICIICGWEDDFAQFSHPDWAVGANKVSLNEYKVRYQNLLKERKLIQSKMKEGLLSDENLFCRVCGWSDGSYVRGSKRTRTSINLCSCCGVNYGSYKLTVSYIKEYRKSWLKKGTPWLFPKEKPDDWSIEDYTKNIPDKYKCFQIDIEKKIVKTLGDQVVESNDEYYIPYNLALKFIEKCEENSLMILGIDGFIINDNGFLPLLDYIADFSSLDKSGDKDKILRSIRSAKSFIAKCEERESLFFNFVLDI